MPLSEEQIEKAAIILGAMCNAQRLAILKILSDGEISVGKLNEHIDLSQSALSQHLSVLRKAKIVDARRNAQTIYYSLTSTFAIKLLATLTELFPN